MHGILFTDCASIRAIGAYRIRTELHYNNYNVKVIDFCKEIIKFRFQTMFLQDKLSNQIRFIYNRKNIINVLF